jgi:uncharacterized membrane protein YidH (DUF202 family)
MISQVTRNKKNRDTTSLRRRLPQRFITFNNMKKKRRKFYFILPRWRIHFDKQISGIVAVMERTNLGYVRTGVAFIVMGLAIIELLSAPIHLGLLKAIGIYLMVAGITTTIYALVKYAVTIMYLRKCIFLRDTISAYLVSIHVLVTAVLAYLLIFIPHETLPPQLPLQPN